MSGCFPSDKICNCNCHSNRWCCDCHKNVSNYSHTAMNSPCYKHYEVLLNKIAWVECLLKDFIASANGRIDKLETDFKEKLDIDYKKWVQYFNEVYPKRSPHKCPVCNGLGCWERNDGVASCITCEGKGIVWG